MKKFLIFLIITITIGAFMLFAQQVNYQMYVEGQSLFKGNATFLDVVRLGVGSTPDITPGADDLFVEGTVEVDGELQADGILDINSTSDFAGAAVFNGNVTLGDAASDIITATGYFTKLRIGTGASPGIEVGADDLFVEGTCEVDDELQVDGILDVNSTSDFADDAVFNDYVTLSKATVISLTAGENLTKGQVVVLVPDDIEDLMNSYADQAAYQAVYVDSDGAHKMVDVETTNFATGLKALKILAVEGDNTGDSVAKTISSKDMSALTIHLLARASAASGDWQIRIGTDNLDTDYYQSAVVVAGADTYEHLTFVVSEMTGAGASEDNTAITRIGFYCVADTGGPNIIVDRIWYTSGSGDYVAMKADSDDWDLMPPLGVATASITDGDAGLIAIGGILDGFTGLVPGAKYYVDDATAGNIIECKAESAIDAIVGIAISETELLIICNTATS